MRAVVQERYPLRLAGYGVRAPKTGVRGREVAGRVETIGADVSTTRVNLTFEQAATAPVSGLTALQGIRDHAQLQAGQNTVPPARPPS